MNDGKIITTGFELECVNLASGSYRLADSEGFGRRYDRSIRGMAGEELPEHGPSAPVELVTPIIETRSELTADGRTREFSYGKMAASITALTSCANQVNSTCGFHVHLGRPNGEATGWNPRRMPGISGGPASEWKPGHVRTMLLISLALEDKLFALVPDSRKRSRHCRRIREVYSVSDLEAYYPVGNPAPRKHDNEKRYCWLNLIETRRQGDPGESRVGYARSEAFGTIEVRLLGETKDSAYCLAWAKLWIKIASAVAYLPSETAALHCLYSNFLQPDFDALSRLKAHHEEVIAPTCRLDLSALSAAVNHNQED